MFPGFLVPGFLEVYLTAVGKRCHRKKQKKGKHEKANFRLISITRTHTALANILFLFFFLIFEIA